MVRGCPQRWLNLAVITNLTMKEGVMGDLIDEFYIETRNAEIRNIRKRDLLALNQ